MCFTLKIIILILSLAAALPASQAPALDLDKAQRLAREADVNTIETAFAQHQASFNAGEITPGAFKRPYWAFRTTEPRVLELADAWLAARPDSPQALVAKAATQIHVAMVVRGVRVVRETPPSSLARMSAL